MSTEENMHTIEVEAGITIDHAAQRLCHAAMRYGTSVAMDFNGYHSCAVPGTLPEHIIADLHAQMDAAQVAYRTSPQYAIDQAEDAARLASMQAQYAKLIQQLPTLNFAADRAVIGWLRALQPSSDYKGIEVDVETILTTFAAHGYQPDMNCRPYFNAADRANVAGWLIGQALACLRDVGAIHQVFHKFAEEWEQCFVKGT